MNGRPTSKRRPTSRLEGRRDSMNDAMVPSSRQPRAGSSRPDFDDLKAFLALGDAHHDLLAGRQRIHAVAAQHGGMDEDVAVGGLARHKAVTALVVVPFDQG